MALVVDEYLCDNVSPLQPGTFICSSLFLHNHFQQRTLNFFKPRFWVGIWDPD